METIWQFALIFIGAALFFALGARSKRLPLNRKTLWEIMQAAAAVVAIAAFLSAGRGCVSGDAVDSNCKPAGPGIYNDC